jgi:hypothetical protein
MQVISWAPVFKYYEFAILIFAPCLAIGSIVMAGKLLAEETWKHTTGHITGSHVHTQIIERRNRRDIYQKLIVSYCYQANGTTYRGVEDEGDPPSVKHPFNNGDTVEIRYNPGHPEESTIHNSNNLKLIAVALASSVVSVAGFIFMLRLKLQPERAIPKPPAKH